MLLMNLQKHLSLFSNQNLSKKKKRPPKPDKGISSAPLFIVIALVILSLRSLHNALRDDEDVSDAEDDKGKRGDIDGKEAANLGGEIIDKRVNSKSILQ